MKKNYSVLVFVITAFQLMAQAPDKISFQAMVRDVDGELVAESLVGIKVSILQGSETGSVVYEEIHSDTTNINGLLAFEIGGGTVVSGVFSDIDWTNGPYFFKREIDPLGGTDYVITGTSQVLSVPFALYASVADTALNSADTSLSNELQTISKTGRTVTLSNNGGSFLDSVLTEAQVDTFAANNGFLTSEMDGDSTNELQSLSISITGDTLYISDGNYLIVPGISVANPPTVSDIDGNEYKTVWIDDQLWFAENLRTSRYNDGTLIPNDTSAVSWTGLTTGARAYYNNDSSTYHSIYGPLYNGYAAESGNLCPTGWHVPTDTEWSTLETFLGSDPGGKLKETGTVHWTPDNTGATNEFGFTALPGGYRLDYNGAFDLIRSRGSWWSGTATAWGTIYYRQLFYDATSVYSANGGKKYGMSVRCLRD